MEHSDAATLVSLIIDDDGCGFDADVVREQGGMGLESMRERVLHLGGTLTISSQPGGGTVVDVSVVC